jgi:hypothetical protein
LNEEPWAVLKFFRVIASTLIHLYKSGFELNIQETPDSPDSDFATFLYTVQFILETNHCLVTKSSERTVNTFIKQITLRNFVGGKIVLNL